MTTAAVIDFWRELEQDAALQQRMASAFSPIEVCSIGAEAGYEFTRDELCGVESVVCFCERAKADDALRARLADVRRAAATPRAALEEVVRVAAELDVFFDADTFEAVARGLDDSLAPANDDELTDADLAAVAGGIASAGIGSAMRNVIERGWAPKRPAGWNLRLP